MASGEAERLEDGALDVGELSGVESCFGARIGVLGVTSILGGDLPAVPENSHRAGKLSRPGAQIVLWISVEVSAQPAGLSCIGAGDTDLDIAASVPHHGNSCIGVDVEGCRTFLYIEVGLLEVWQSDNFIVDLHNATLSKSDLMSTNYYFDFLGPGNSTHVSIIVGHLYNEVLVLAIHGHNVSASPLEVDQFAIKGSVVRIPESDACCRA